MSFRKYRKSWNRLKRKFCEYLRKNNITRFNMKECTKKDERLIYYLKIDKI